VKPAPFEYVAPDSLSGALEALAQHGGEAKVLAGGQSLIPVLSFRLAQPAVLVDLNRIAELSYIRPAADGGLEVGAMTRQRRLEREPLVAARAPLLAEAGLTDLTSIAQLKALQSLDLSSCTGVGARPIPWPPPEFFPISSVFG
jgi:CO/xanthine dehydrogenase FAD-binding subunit